MDFDRLFASMSKITAYNTEVSASVSARALVLGKFTEVAMSLLTTGQCLEIEPAFREAIEEIMGMADDVALPQAFHSELLSMTNEIIESLNNRSGATWR